jgi:hypothetical protein
LESRLQLAGDAAITGGVEWIVRTWDDATSVTPDGLNFAVGETLDAAQARFVVAAPLGLSSQFLLRQTHGTPQRGALALAQHPRLQYAAMNGAAEGLNQRFPNEEQLADFAKLLSLHNVDSQSGGDINAPEAWDVETGRRDVMVGVIDTGIDYTHPDLYRNVWLNQGEIPAEVRLSLADADEDGLVTFVDLNASQNAPYVTDHNANGRIDAGDLLVDPQWANGVNDDGNVLGEGPSAIDLVDDLIGWDFANHDNDPFDDHGHGTHVVGVIGAEGNNAQGVVGVNWAVSIVPLKFLDASNRGETSNAIQALNYARSLRDSGVNLRVLNNSWESSEGFNAALVDTIQELDTAEMLFVAGAGNGSVFRLPNDNDVNPVYPASYNVGNVLSVAATDAEDQLVPFYNFGASSVHLAAPGLSILSTEPGGGVNFRSGTSFSTAFVSGAAALALAQLPADATVDEVRASLLQGADSLPSLEGKITSGARLNAHGALEVDAYQPRAFLREPQALRVDARNIVSLEFEVEYRDNRQVRHATLSHDDLLIQRSSDKALLQAELISTSTSTDADVIVARYRVNASAGVWRTEDNGSYDVLLPSGEVQDLSGNAARPAERSPTNLQRLATLSIDVPALGTFVVNSFYDAVDVNPGDGEAADAHGRATLRAAAMEANADPLDNIIVLPAGVFTLTLPGAAEDESLTGDLDITDVNGELTIQGQSPEATILDAAGLDRMFDITAGATVTLRNLTLRGGQADLGGALLNRGAAVNLHHVAIRQNQAVTGGGIAQSAGELILENVIVADNHASDEGGGLAVQHGHGVVRDSEIRSNVAGKRGGGLASDGMLEIVNTMVHGNETTASNSGGGGLAVTGPTTLDGANILDNRAGVGEQGLTRDAFEPNDQSMDAVDRYRGNQMLDGLSIHVPGDNDYFRWTAPRSGDLTVQLNSQFATGDLSLAVLDAEGVELARSETSSDLEQIVVSVVQHQTVLIRVFGASADAVGSYALQIDQPDATETIRPDLFESNDEFATATNLGGGEQFIGGLTLHSAEDRDVFRWNSHIFSTMSVFVGASIAVAVFDDQGVLLAEESVTGFVSLSVTPGATYFVQVAVAPDTFGQEYRLHLAGTEPPLNLGPDAAEPNPSLESATDLGSADISLPSLTLDVAGDVDYFRWTAPRSGEVAVESLLPFGSPHEFMLSLEDEFGAPLPGVVLDVLPDRLVTMAYLLEGQTAYIRMTGNVAESPLAYSLTVAGPPAAPQPDLLEPNDERESATVLEGGSQSLWGLSIDTSEDRDYYQWTATTDASTDLSLTFRHADGDLSLVLYDANGVELARSETSSHFETVSFDAIAGNTYVLEVFGVGGATNPTYDLSFVVQVDPPIPPDAFEPNNTLLSAADRFSGDQSMFNLSLAPSDEDYFTWTASTDGVLQVRAFSQFALANLDLVVMDEDGVELARSQTEFDQEQVIVPVVAGQTVGIRIFVADGGVHPLYILEIDGPDLTLDPCEPNDTRDAAFDLGGGDQTLDQLSFHTGSDDDYFRWTATESGPLSIFALALSGSDPLELILYDQDGAELGRSEPTLFPLVEFNAIAGHVYVFQVASGAGTAVGEYSLVVDGPEPGISLTPDAFEPNDTTETATERSGANQTLLNLSLHAPGDQDYFRWTAQAEGFLTVNARFTHAEGDLSLIAMDEFGIELARAESGDDDEELFVPVVRGQTVLIRVHGYLDAVQPHYDLQFAGPGSLSVPLEPDVLEPNNSLAQATDVGGGSQVLHFASVHDADDVDTFHWIARQGGSLFVSLIADIFDDDLMFAVLDETGEVLEVSQTPASGSEFIFLEVTEDARYYIQVLGFDGATSSRYELRLDEFAFGGGEPQADLFEPNDTFDNATSRPTGDQSLENLSIDDSSDEDFFVWTASAAGTLTVDVQFLHFLGDLTLVLLDQSGHELARSETSNDGEHLAWPVSAGQTVGVRVFGADGAVNESYSLTFNGPDPAVPLDVLEANDTFESATPLIKGDLHIDHLTLHNSSDVDYFRWTPFQAEVAELTLLSHARRGRTEVVIFDNQGQEVARSFQSAGGVAVAWNVIPDVEYVIRISGAEGVTNTDYSLQLSTRIASQTIVADAFEPNDSLDAAFPRGVGDHSLHSLTIDHPDDEDYFLWISDADGNVSIRVETLSLEQTLTLVVLGADGQELAKSESGNAVEQFTVHAVAGQTLAIRVSAGGPDTITRYDLHIEQAARIGADAFEPNNAVDSAVDLASGDQTLFDLNIHEPGDIDYFRWTSDQDGEVIVELGFDGIRSVPDVAILNADGVELARTDILKRRLRIPVAADMDYFFQVFSLDGQAGYGYHLIVDALSTNAVGGGLWISSGAEATTPVQIHNSLFLGNQADSGGGVYNDVEGELTVTNSAFSHNVALSRGADSKDFFGYRGGGGLYTAGDATLTEVTFAENRSTAGGGIDIDPISAPVVLLDSSLLVGNVAHQDLYSAGGGIRNGRASQGGGNLTVRHTTLRDNRSRFEGGGISNSGRLLLEGSTLVGNVASAGGGMSTWGELTAENSTWSGNHATADHPTLRLPNLLFQEPNGEGGALFAFYRHGINPRGFGGNTTTLNSVTITNNTADAGSGGVFADSSAIVASRSVIANNRLMDGSPIDFNSADRAQNYIEDYDGQLISLGSNVFGYAAPGGRWLLDPSDTAGVSNLGLTTLRDNGGPTWTHLPLPGSPLVDGAGAIDGTDQRGVIRPFDGDHDGVAQTDIGAVERAHGEIAGVVFLDRNANGVEDPGEPRLPQQTVFLDANGNGDADPSEIVVTTDDTGAFAFPLLEPGEHHVRVLAGEFITVENATITVNLAPGELRDELVFAATSSHGRVRGVAYNDQNGNGRRDDREAGIANWEVFLDLNNNGAWDADEPRTLSDDQGRYEFANLPPGSYLVEQILKAGWIRTSPLPAHVLNVDFDNDQQAAAWEGFSVSGSAAFWRLSTETSEGPSANTVAYFGVENGDAYLANSHGVLTSPPLNLTNYSGTILLTFQHRLNVSGIDAARVNVASASGITTLASSQVSGGLVNSIGAWEPVTLDVSGFAGQVIQVQFELASNLQPRRSERLTATVTEGETYYLHVGGVDGSTLSQYRLTVDGHAASPDRLEPNDGLASATDLGELDLLSVRELSLHVEEGVTNDDFFRFTSRGSGIIDIHLAFEDTQGNLDVVLLDQDGQPVATGDAAIDSERIRAEVAVGQTYYLQVMATENVTNPQYQLTIDAPGVHPDRYEPDDSFSRTPLVAVTDLVVRDLTFHENEDSDFFVLTPQFSGPVRVELQYDLALGPMILDVRADGVIQGSNSASATFNAVAGQSYLIDILNFGFTQVASYQLVIDAAGIATDALESNRNLALASDLGNLGFRSIGELTLHDEDDNDYFRFVAASSGDVDFELLFDQADGDADLTLYDVIGAQIASTRHRGWSIDDVQVRAVGNHALDLDVGQEVADVHFGNQSLLGSGGSGLDRRIEGRLFNDLNQNRRLDTGETGVPGMRIWLDYISNGIVDPGETVFSQSDDPQTPEDETGRYEFTGLADGSYQVHVLPGSSAYQTSPVDNRFIRTDTRSVGTPHAILLADLNDDGAPDLAAPNGSGNVVSVFLSQASGGVAMTDDAYTTAPPNSQPEPVFLEAAPIDASPGLDLLVVNFHGKSVALLSNDGRGAFLPFQIILDLNAPEAGELQGFSPTSLAVGRFNGDAYADLAITLRPPRLSDPGRVAILLNDGQGRFTQGEILTVGVAPESIAAGQFNDDNGDGRINSADRLDLAVANVGASTGGVSVFLNRGNSLGVGLFGPAQTLATPQGVFSLVAGDVSGDGAADLAAANATGRTILVLHNDGAGQFAPSGESLQAGLVTGVRLVDVDQDGDLDVAASTGFDRVQGADVHPAVRIFRNPGNGLFPIQSGQSIGVGSLQTSNFYSLAAADLDADQTIDLAVASIDRGEVILLKGALDTIGRTVNLNQPVAFGVDFGLVVTNAPPTLDPVAPPFTTLEDAPLQTIGLTGISSGAGESQLVSLTIETDDPSLFADLSIANVGSGAGEVRYRPAANRHGAAQVTVHVRDGGVDGILGNADDSVFSRTFPVAITPVNDAPTLEVLTDPPPVAEDSSEQTIEVSGITAGGGETQSLRITATSSVPALIPHPAVSFTSPNATGELTWAPNPNQSGTAVITITVFDAGLDGVPGNGDDASTSRTVTLTVDPVNDPPTLAPIVSPPPMLEGAPPATIFLSNVTAGGSENQALRVSATSNNPALIMPPVIQYAAPATTGWLTVVTQPDRSGVVVITVRVTDAGLDGVVGNADDASFEQHFTVVVQSRIYPPRFDPVAIPTRLPEDAAEQVVAITGIAPGRGHALTLTAISSNPDLIPHPLVSYTSPQSFGALSFQPIANAYGAATLIVTITDLGLDGILGTADDASFSQVAHIEVDPVNDPPLLDLNGDQHAGEDWTVQFIARGAPALLTPQSPGKFLSLRDKDNLTLQNAVAVLQNPIDGAAEALTVDVAKTRITAAYNATTGTLSLHGDDSLENYARVLSSLAYRNTADQPTLTSRIVHVHVDDGSHVSAVATVEIGLVNRRQRHDVNADGLLTLADLLSLVQTARSLTLPRLMDELSISGPPFVDVDGNRWFTIGDVLDVVQELRTQAEVRAEPESPPHSDLFSIRRGQPGMPEPELDEEQLFNLIAFDIHNHRKNTFQQFGAF